MTHRDLWPDEDEEPPSEIGRLIEQIGRELRAELAPERAREWNRMVKEVFGAARHRRCQ